MRMQYSLHLARLDQNDHVSSTSRCQNRRNDLQIYCRQCLETRQSCAMSLQAHVNEEVSTSERDPLQFIPGYEPEDLFRENKPPRGPTAMVLTPKEC